MDKRQMMTIDGETWVKIENVEQGQYPYIIARCGDAGVHAGYLIDRDPENKIVLLAQSLRLWKWHGRTLSGLALEGPDDIARCKFGPAIGTAERPHEVANYCEILPVTDAAKAVILSVPDWVND